jgi:hypothetical protein
MTSSIVNRRDSAKSNGGHSVAVVEVLSVVVQSFYLVITYKIQLIQEVVGVKLSSLFHCTSYIVNRIPKEQGKGIIKRTTESKDKAKSR